MPPQAGLIVNLSTVSVQDTFKVAHCNLRIINFCPIMLSRYFDWELDIICSKSKGTLRLLCVLCTVFSQQLSSCCSTFEGEMQIGYTLLHCQRGLQRNHIAWMYNPAVISRRKLNQCWVYRRGSMRVGKIKLNCGTTPHGYHFGCNFKTVPLGNTIHRYAVSTAVHSFSCTLTNRRFLWFHISILGINQIVESLWMYCQWPPLFTYCNRSARYVWSHTSCNFLHIA